MRLGPKVAPNFKKIDFLGIFEQSISFTDFGSTWDGFVLFVGGPNLEKT